MVLELVAGALGKIGGRVEYDAAFDVFLTWSRRMAETTCLAMLMLLNGCVFGYCCKIGPPSILEDEVPKGGTLGLSIAIQPYQLSPELEPYASDRLIKTLRETHLFTQVDDVRRVVHPDVIVRIEEKVRGRNVIPLFTLMTFGVFPTVFDDRCGITFVIFKPDSPLNQVVINYRRETTETLGIAANFMLLFPGYRFATPEETPEYVDGLARRLWGMRESFSGRQVRRRDWRLTSGCTCKNGDHRDGARCGRLAPSCR
jgi:hypothetical protein